MITEPIWPWSLRTDTQQQKSGPRVLQTFGGHLFLSSLYGSNQALWIVEQLRASHGENPAMLEVHSLVKYSAHGSAFSLGEQGK